MTNEELAKAIEGLDPTVYTRKGEFSVGYEVAKSDAARLVRANALRPASEATVGEDVMIVSIDGDVVKAKLVPENAYSSARFERGDDYWWRSEVRGWFPAPEFAKVNP